MSFEPLNILIGHEETQAVTLAFRKLEHNAYSNDLKDCSGGRPDIHLKMDVNKAIELKKWDFIGLHPVCTKMALSGNRHYAPGKHKNKERIEAIEMTINLWQKAISVCDAVYMENPIGALNSDIRLPKPQIIHPYYFGDEARKQTCIWLHGLPKLIHAKQDDLFTDKTHVSQGESYVFIDKKTGKEKRQPLWYAQAKGFGGKQLNRDYSEARSKTFKGIAEAMSVQWSEYLLRKLKRHSEVPF